ncbi:disease resistance protein RUN1-like [Rosa chinensis]|uniref:disease resistance protein RUN1-like n=1 Tax=Rosa chinensis TaxID=74649 RepID=UPI000D08B216|nr:disease resistance protein RUN1-like [Rosa chinensis]
MVLFRGTETSSSKYATSPSGTSYDVFLSFRGKDTRKTFTDHLYTALLNAGFHTFRDDPELEKGESVKENLEKAVQQSRSSVIVLSKDYASSRWCLHELVTILERKRISCGHHIIPVFYDVDPSHVRKQAENLAKIPKYQGNQSSEKLNECRAALTEVADLAGMVLQNQADGHESKFIQSIVKVIQDKLGRLPLSVIKEVLMKKLSFSNTVLDDSEGKQLNNPAVKDWLSDLKESVYDADDLLQEINTEVLRQKMEPELESSLSKGRGSL